MRLPAHSPITTSMTPSQILDGNVRVRDGFFPTLKWLISCSPHDAAMEVLQSELTNEMCFKKIGEREINYRTIGSSGFCLRFHGAEINLDYTEIHVSSDITVEGRPLSSYSPEEQRYFESFASHAFNTAWDARS